MYVILQVDRFFYIQERMVIFFIVFLKGWYYCFYFILRERRYREVRFEFRFFYFEFESLFLFLNVQILEAFGLSQVIRMLLRLDERQAILYVFFFIREFSFDYFFFIERSVVVVSCIWFDEDRRGYKGGFFFFCVFG